MTTNNKDASRALAIFLLIAAAAILLICYDAAQGQTPVILPEFRQDTDTVINRDGQVLMFYHDADSTDTLVFDPETGIYWKDGDTLTQAIFDSLVQGLGRFSVSSGLWTNLTDSVVLIQGTDTIAYYKIAADSVVTTTAYDNNGHTSFYTVVADTVRTKNGGDTTWVYRLGVSGNYWFPQTDGADGAVLATNGSGVLSWSTRSDRGADQAGDDMRYEDGQYHVDGPFCVYDGTQGNDDSLNPTFSNYSFAANYTAIEGEYGMQFIDRDSNVYSLLLNDTNDWLYLTGVDFYAGEGIYTADEIVLNSDTANDDAGVRFTDKDGTIYDLFWNGSYFYFEFDSSIYVVGDISAAGDMTIVGGIYCSADGIPDSCVLDTGATWVGLTKLDVDSLCVDSVVQLPDDISGPADCIPDSLVNYSIAPWNWSDSSSHGPDSVLFADTCTHADSAAVVATDVMNHTLDSAEVVQIIRDTTYVDSSLVGAIARDSVTFAWSDSAGHGPDSVVWSDTAAYAAAAATDWDWADSSSHGPDSVLYADTAAYATAFSGSIEDLTVTDDLTVGDTAHVDFLVVDSGTSSNSGNWDLINGHVATSAGYMSADSMRAARLVATSAITLPNGANPTTDAVGEMAIDTDIPALEVYDTIQDVSMVVPLYQSKTMTIWDPEGLTDTIPILYIDSATMPGGIEVLGLEVQLSADADADTYLLQWMFFTAADPPVLSDFIDTLVVAENDSRKQSVTFENSTVAVGQQVYILTDPDEDIDWLRCSIRYYIKEHN